MKRAAALSTRTGAPRRWAKTIGIGVLVVLALAIGLLHVMPLTPSFPACSRRCRSASACQSLSRICVILLLTPQLKLEGVSLGKLQEIKIENVVVGAGPLTLLGETKELDDVEVNSPTVDQDALSMMTAWVKPQSGAQPFSLRQLKLKNVRLSLTAVQLPPFDADIRMGPTGRAAAMLNVGGTLRVDVVPKDKAWRASIEARSWQPPLGPAFTFDDLSVVAVVESGRPRLLASRAGSGGGH